MKLYIHINDKTSAIERVSLEHTSSTGQRLATYEHAQVDPGTGRVTLSPLPPAFDQIVAWVVERANVARKAHLDRQLLDVAGIPPARLAEAIAALEKIRGRDDEEPDES